ncbi:hypothetical protein J2D73_00675 [Acetobacter sacchari]|uniref:Uncharacterized protein n=1 Tax=Acetobacter sacchari TaxID=2661687 RepID=A0ABS3LQX3_9PROT|nr:hypothetical protein [Acetobacter sacchari]MBO1358310.1 hypothetical protein [Acetobacter sacchari]
MTKISHALGAVASIVAAIAFVAPAKAGTATYWGPRGGVTTVHSPGPYVHPMWGSCCYAPLRGAAAVAAGVATGAAIRAAAQPYPYGYPYPVYVAPRPVVYPPAIIVAPAPSYVYPARPLP